MLKGPFSSHFSVLCLEEIYIEIQLNIIARAIFVNLAKVSLIFIFLFNLFQSNKTNGCSLQFIWLNPNLTIAITELFSIAIFPLKVFLVCTEFDNQEKVF